MGQAQLLLIVLGTVVVGLAVMAGINAYEQNNIKSDLDAVALECTRLASDAQTMAQKPENFGGLWDTTDDTEVGNGFDFAERGGSATTLAILGWDSPAASSTIALSGISATGLTVTCTSLKFPGSGTNSNQVQIVINGVNANNLTTTTTQFDPDPPA